MNTVAPPLPQVLHLQIQQQIKNIWGKKIPESYSKQNLN